MGAAYYIGLTETVLAEIAAHPDKGKRGTLLRERCPPFKTLLLALCFTEYDRCIRGDEPPLGKAGRLDMFSSVYLPYCKMFLTNDEGQFKALTLVAELMGREMSIMMWEVFKANLFGLSAAAP